MGEILLFKAKRLDNGEWVSGGSIIQFVDDGVRKGTKKNVRGGK